MKMKFLNYLLLVSSFGVHYFSKAQTMNPSDSLATKKGYPLKYYIAIDPFHIGIGEWKLSQEVQWHKQLATELDAGYFNNMYSIVYHKFVSYSTNQAFIDNKYFYNSNEGFGGNVTLKYYRKGNLKNGSYFSFLAGYRNIQYFNVVTRFNDETVTSPICSNCYTFEHIKSQTLSLRIGYGWQIKVVKNVIAGIFINVGYKLVINNSTIDGIYYVKGLYEFSTPSKPNIYFDNYKIKYYQYLPSFDLGIKIGWAK